VSAEDLWRRVEEERNAGSDVLASYDAMRKREDARTAQLLAQVIAPVEAEADEEDTPVEEDDDRALGRALLDQIDRSRHEE